MNDTHSQALGLLESLKEAQIAEIGIVVAVLSNLVRDGEYENALTYALGAADALVVFNPDAATALGAFRRALKSITRS